MSKQGFYNDNMFRTYPFIDPDNGVGLPKSTIVDFGCYICSDVQYVEGQNNVWLRSVSRTGNAFTFTFECDAAGLTGNYLVFTRYLSDPEMSYSFSDFQGDYTSSDAPLNDHNESDSFNSCPEKILWEGYLVTGNLEELAAILSSGNAIYGVTNVEPSLVVNIQDSSVRTINIANRLPVTVTPAEGCGTASDGEKPIYVYRSCITGDITFSHGYSCNVNLTNSSNEISFTATVSNSIKGQFCGNEEDTGIYLKSNLVPGMQVSSKHTVPSGSVLYTGGPSCRETLKSINGINAKRLWIVGGRGIGLTTDPETNTIYVEATLSGLAICANSSLSLSSAMLNG